MTITPVYTCKIVFFFLECVLKYLQVCPIVLNLPQSKTVATLCIYLKDFPVRGLVLKVP